MAKRMNFPIRKQIRREEAEERQTAYNKLSAEEKLARAIERGSETSREAIRLSA